MSESTPPSEDDNINYAIAMSFIVIGFASFFTICFACSFYCWNRTQDELNNKSVSSTEADYYSNE